jgi:hypothetical protein
MTYKFHTLYHMLDDLLHYACQLDFLSSYMYENFHARWRRWLRTGNKPLPQLRLIIHI